MKPWSAVRLGEKRTARLLIVVFLAVGATQTACKTNTVSYGFVSMPQPQAPRQTEAPVVKSAFSRVVCLAFGSYVVPSPQSKTGHRVILSWKPSPPANSKHSAAVGYCIYRGTEPNRLAERINFLPFAGTKCADDSVEDGKKYYYDVRAITAEGITSTTSRPATASIPSRPRTTAEVSADSLPLCRPLPQ